MLVEIKRRATKKRRMVGIRESEIKETTSLVFSFVPRTF
jgi:hypothetical protein